MNVNLPQKCILSAALPLGAYIGVSGVMGGELSGLDEVQIWGGAFCLVVVAELYMWRDPGEPFLFRQRWARFAFGAGVALAVAVALLIVWEERGPQDPDVAPPPPPPPDDARSSAYDPKEPFRYVAEELKRERDGDRDRSRFSR